jgi:hypothetical protein
MVSKEIKVTCRKDMIHFLLSRDLPEEAVFKLFGPEAEHTIQEVIEMGPAQLEKISGISGKRFKRAFAWVDLQLDTKPSKKPAPKAEKKKEEKVEAEPEEEDEEEPAPEPEKKEKEMGFIWTSPDGASIEESLAIIGKKKKMLWPCKFYVNLKRFDLPIEGYIYIKSEAVAYKAKITEIETDKDPLPPPKKKDLIPPGLSKVVPEDKTLAYLTLEEITPLPHPLPLRAFTTVNNTPVKSARQYTLIWIEDFEELVKKEEGEQAEPEPVIEEAPKKKVVEEIEVLQFKPLATEDVEKAASSLKTKLPEPLTYFLSERAVRESWDVDHIKGIIKDISVILPTFEELQKEGVEHLAPAKLIFDLSQTLKKRSVDKKYFKRICELALDQYQ